MCRQPALVIACPFSLRTARTFAPGIVHNSHAESWTCAPWNASNSQGGRIDRERPTDHSTGRIPGGVPRSSSPHSLPISRTPPSQGGDRGFDLCQLCRVNSCRFSMPGRLARLGRHPFKVKICSIPPSQDGVLQFDPTPASLQGSNPNRTHSSSMPLVSVKHPDMTQSTLSLRWPSPAGQ